MNYYASLSSWDVAKSIHDVGWSDDTQTTTQALTVKAQAAQSKSLTPIEQYELCIAPNAAINAICRNLSKARIRLFTKTGREITGGDCAELFRMPAPKFSQRKLLWEISAWLNIAGEFFLNILQRDGVPYSLVPLAPTHMSVKIPTTPPNSIEDVVQWEYRHPNGPGSTFIRADYVCFERLFNPNARSIRGASPLTTGAVLNSSAFYAERYNKNFFENNAIPSHIINVGEGVPKIQREAFARDYFRSYGNFANNAHKVAVVAGGKDFGVEVLEQPFQDGAFMEMMKRADLKVGQLFRVPAVNMGIYDKTRFDTANEERKLFLEETLEPEAELIAEALQMQIVDPYFANSEFSTGRAIKECRKTLRDQFEKAEAERGQRIILLVDTDTLPIKHEVQLAKTEHALKLREAYDISAKTAEMFVGMDFDDDRPERSEIFAPNNRVCITNPKLNEALIPGVKGGAEEKKPPAKDVDPAQAKSAKTFLRKVRRLTLDALDNGTMWSLTEGDTLAGDEKLKPLVRFVRNRVRKCENKAQVKEFLNHLDPTLYLHVA